MKKLLALFLCLVTALSLVACSSSSSSSTTAPASTTVPSATQTETTKGWTPSEAITIIVPFSAGGGTDVMSRATIGALDMPVAVTVNNISGGGSSIGAMEAYYSEPDGATLFSVGFEALMAGVYSGTYSAEDAYEKFIPLCNVADDCVIVIASKASGLTTLDELIEEASAHPGELTCSGTGSMSFTNAATVEFFEKCDLDIIYVPYDSGTANRTAVMGGHEDIGIMCGSEAISAIESGDCVPICVLSAERSEFYPDLPCANEYGDYNLDVTLHRAIFCTPGTPDEIVDYYNEKFAEACEDADVQAKLRNLYYAPNFIGAEDLKTLGDARYSDMEGLFATIMAQ